MDLLKTICSETYWMQLGECEVLKVSPGSTVVSPFGLRLPLCALAAVARGHAKEELMSALGMSRESEIKNCYRDVNQEVAIMASYDLMLKNVIYLNESLEVAPSFKNSSRRYSVRIDKAGFRYPTAAAKYMNRWFAQETLYRVSTLIDEDDIDNTTSMVILSGIYYKVSWEMPFYLQFTKPMKFYDLKNNYEIIPMLCKLDSFLYFDDVNNNFKVLTIHLGTPGASISFYLPETRTGLPDLIKKLSNDPELMTESLKKLQMKRLRIYLPRMQIKTYVDWSGFMRLIGINDVFSVNASGLEGILKNDSNSHVYLSTAKQKIFMEMDELGVMRQKPENTMEQEAREFAEFGDDLEQLEFDHPFFFTLTVSPPQPDKTPVQMLIGAFHGPYEG
ncbi:hypothetical protein ABMA27_016257 [Loxostege sticticalis]|uniref:Serpin domain-containing protein n=1 Tax=Loxostege sticticalis TaxID=481309 RepID=A0ABR3I6A8_LOXSC